MAEATGVDVDERGGRAAGRRLTRLLGGAAILALGAGGFLATYSGLLRLPIDAVSEGGDAGATGGASTSGTRAAFVEIPQMLISLGPSAGARHLRLAASLDVAPRARARVEAVLPRILDVINTYLQALDEADVERPAAMARMRAQLLRRIRLVAGEDAVRDLLITEFVLQ